MSRWQLFKMDMQERFLNFETVNGLYLFPACAFGLYCVWVDDLFKYSIQIGMTIFYVYGAYIGLRKVLVNRIKQKLSQERLLKKRKALTDDITVS
jgi:hypothetical protein